jgi:hypothetical protein
MSCVTFDGSEYMLTQRNEFAPLPVTSGTKHIRILILYPECVCADGGHSPRKVPIVGVGHCSWCEQILGEFDARKWEELYGQNLQWPTDTNLNT